jgi:hypothetical protein
MNEVAKQLAADILDWDEQFGPTNPAADAACEVAPEDMVRWVEWARQIKGERNGN